MKRDTIILIASGVTLFFLLYFDFGEIAVIRSIYSLLNVKQPEPDDYAKLHWALDKRILGIVCSLFLTLLQIVIMYFARKPKNGPRSA
jgi:hypothetical protein